MEIPLPSDLQEVVQVFQRSNIDVYLVGGSVRDAVMGKKPKDYDLATPADPDTVISLFEGMPYYKLLTVGKSFGVVVVVTPEGEEYEVATFRKDLSAGRRPDAVEFTDIESDVKRRDLTINALFYDLKTHEIVDYVGGINDIKNNVVRTVGDPNQRFGEDRLRVLRAFRFAGRIGAELDPATADSIENDNKLAGVSPERIRDEFLKGIKSSQSVVYFLSLLDKFGMFEQIFPGLVVGKDFEETRNIPVQLALLLRMNDSIVLAAKLNSLKYSAEEVSQVTFLVDFANAKRGMPILRMKKSFVRSKLTDEDLLDFASAVNFSTVELAKKFTAFQPTITSADLITQGFKGKEIGDEMTKLEQQKWSDHLGM